MALFLRKLGGRKPWMLPRPAWLPSRDVAMAHIPDLLPDKEGKLSVWTVKPDRSDLPRVLAAIAGTRDAIQKIDYVLFDSTMVRASGAAVQAAPGKTPDSAAAGKWHRDLAELSAKRTARLAWRVFCRASRDRASGDEVIAFLLHALYQGWIRFDDLKPGVKQRLVERARYEP